MHQCYNMPDVDMIFTGNATYPIFLFYLSRNLAYTFKKKIFFLILVQVATPDLSLIFEQKKRRFYKRTSSAQWGNAPVTHKY